MTLRNSSPVRRTPINFDNNSASVPDEDAADPTGDLDATDSTAFGHGENGRAEYPVLAELLDADFKIDDDDSVLIIADEYANCAQGFEEDEHAKAESTNVHADSAVVSGPVVAELVATRSELRRVESELQGAERERDVALDAEVRLQADFYNFRKRSERDRAEARQVLIGEVVCKLLPVVDNFRRAVKSRSATSGDELSQFVVGVELIRKQLDDVLCSYGVETIAAVGEIFDPHYHEAVATEARADVPPGTILEEVVRGYRIGERLLRPAAVKVATTL